MPNNTYSRPLVHWHNDIHLVSGRDRVKKSKYLVQDPEPAKRPSLAESVALKVSVEEVRTVPVHKISIKKVGKVSTTVNVRSAPHARYWFIS